MELRFIGSQDNNIVKRYDTGVILHLYYPEMWEGIYPYLINLGKEFDLFVTIPYGVDISEDVITERFPKAQIYRCENRGRDVAPFLVVFSAIAKLGYKFLCKIHTKKSPHITSGIEWQQDMLRKLLGSRKIILRIKKAFDEHPDWGLIAPQGHVVPYNYYWELNATNVIRLAQSVGMPTDHLEFSYVAGSMFWFRPQAFDLLLETGTDTQDFEVEQGKQDGTLAHAFERFFGMAANHAGYKIAESDLEEVRLADISFQFRLLIQASQNQEQDLVVQRAEKDQQVQALKDQLSEKEQSAQTLRAKLGEIYGSRTWRFVHFLWRIRSRLIPVGSRRERFIRILMRYFRYFHQRLKSGITDNERVDKSPKYLSQQRPFISVQEIYKKSFRKKVKSIDLIDNQNLNTNKKEYKNSFSQDHFLQINGLPLPEKIDIIICVGPSNNISSSLESIHSYTKPGSYSLHLVVHEDDAAFIPEYHRSNPYTHIYIHKMKLFNYAKANNLALKNCDGDVVLLNDDAEVTEGWLEKLKEASKGVALTGAHTGYQRSGNPQMWGAGALTVTRFPINMFCAYIPIRLRSIVGLLDEEYCYYGGDDVDYSCRALLNGFPLVISRAYITHKDNQSYRESKELLIKESDKIIAERYGISSPFELSNITPKVSVIMATRNRPKLLITAIKSILYMDYQNFEFIIIDDNSDKKTSLIIRECQEKDDRIISVRLPRNVGLTKARDIGVRASKGQFIFFSDDDDTVLPNRISSPLDFLLKNPLIDVVYCNYNLVSEGGIKATFCEPFDINAYLNLKFDIGSGILFGRRQAFLNVPFMSIYDRAVDYDWVFRLVRQGYKIDLCPDIVMNYNRTGSPDSHLSGNSMSIKIHGAIHDREILLKSIERN